LWRQGKEEEEEKKREKNTSSTPRAMSLCKDYCSVEGNKTPLTDAEIGLLNRWWRAANYLSVGQIYLLDNPLLFPDVALRPEDVKPRLLGHWGTTPGLNFIYAHLNRIINVSTHRGNFPEKPLFDFRSSIFV
jgi:hypothetical protein